MKGGFFGAQPKSKAAVKSAPTAAASPVPPVSEPVQDAPMPASIGPDSAPMPSEAGPSSSPADVPAAAETVPDEEDEGTGMVPNTGNGLDLDTYSWTQTLAEVTIMVKVPKGTRGRDCSVDIDNKKLSAGLKGQPPVLQGTLDGEVVVDECYWNCDGSAIEITLQKKDRMSWWKTTVEGEPEVNTRKVLTYRTHAAALDGICAHAFSPGTQTLFTVLYQCPVHNVQRLYEDSLCVFWYAMLNRHVWMSWHLHSYSPGHHRYASPGPRQTA